MGSEQLLAFCSVDCHNCYCFLEKRQLTNFFFMTCFRNGWKVLLSKSQFSITILTRKLNFCILSKGFNILFFIFIRIDHPYILWAIRIFEQYMLHLMKLCAYGVVGAHYCLTSQITLISEWSRRSQNLKLSPNFSLLITACFFES